QLASVLGVEEVEVADEGAELSAAVVEEDDRRVVNAEVGGVGRGAGGEALGEALGAGVEGGAKAQAGGVFAAQPGGGVRSEAREGRELALRGGGANFGERALEHAVLDQAGGDLVACGGEAVGVVRR